MPRSVAARKSIVMDQDKPNPPTALPPPRPRAPFRRRALAGAALLGAFVLGGGTVGAALHHQRPTFVALTPAPIDAMRDGAAVAVKGEVAELFGKDFVLQDGSGRALVDLGPEGEGGGLVGKAETVTVQGRFERGIVHAMAIQHADGHTDALGPPGPPRPGFAGWFHRHDPRG